jgi:outer membrane immunogenic protein
MRKVFLCAAVSAGLGGSAAAADMPVKAPVYVAPPFFSWTGFYLGGNIGGARESIDNLYAAPGLPNGYLAPDAAAIDAGSSNSFNTTSVTYGFEAGYNVRWWSNLVVGAEFDIDGIGRSNSVANTFAAPTAGPVTSTTTQSANWLFTARGRLGWAFDRLLVFGTGGLAYVHGSLSETDVYSPVLVASGTDSVSVSGSNAGWVAGGGIEYAWTDHWTVKGEYLHVGMPNRSATSVTPSPFVGNPATVSYFHSVSTEFDIGRFGINYKF